MNATRGFRQKLIMAIAATALITGTAVFFTVSFFKGEGSTNAVTATASDAQPGETAGTEREIIYWRAPMDPMEIYDEPGKSKMGMDLVPVYADEADGGSGDGGERTIVYWRAPMDPTEIYDQPGKSKMGMDLVPVYEDELVGGVDIKIDPVVRQNMGLRTATVRKGLLDNSIRTYGNVTYDDTRTYVISARAGGWVEHLYAGYTGFFVKKGDPLYEIYSPALVAAQEEYLTALRNHDRHKNTINTGLVAAAAKRLAYFDIGEREIQEIKASGSVSRRLVVRSAVTGVVTRKNVLEGAYVTPGTSLFTVSDLSRVWVEAHIFEYEQDRLRLGQTAEMTLAYQPGKVYTGKIAYIFPYLQPKTRDVVIRLVFDNPGFDLKPDMFATIRINTGDGSQGLLIPAEAVIHSGREKLVFIQKDSGTFSPRQITTGTALESGEIQVVTGLTQGETVVVSGQFLLDSESRLKEAIRKMMEAQGPADSDGEDPDDFFEDMMPEDPGGADETDFFTDMEAEAGS